MPKLRDISCKKLISIFKSFGFEIVSQKGSHIKMSRFSVNLQILVIPNHTSIDKGTLKDIYNQASSFISKAELRKVFYS